MPFRSEAQRKWMFANHPEMARRWAAETPKGKLPEKVKHSSFVDEVLKIAAPSDFAPGLPSKQDVGELKNLKPGFVDFIVQRHEAEKAGPHYDVRFGTPETGLYSWATKKELPKPGERIALFQQPVHRHEYKEFEGEITEGYGKGKVRKHEEGQLLVTKVTDKSIHFTKAHKKFPERFVLLKPQAEEEKRWLLINTTPTEPIPYQKLRYSKVAPENAEAALTGMKPGSSVQAKIDGAAALTKIMEDKLEVVSYRTAKETGYPIVHTERVFQGPVTVRVPKKFVGTVLRGELYGVSKGRAIPPQELGGILNSAVHKSIKTQIDRDISLKNLVFDIQQLGGKSVKDLPYERRLELVRSVLEHLPKDQFHGPEEAKTPEEALKMLEQIRSGKHPLTREGVILHHPEGKPTKIKFKEDHDVHITGLFPGKGKYQDAVGGFTYALKPGGKTVGKVGTGFSDELRRDMARNPRDYIGRVAKVEAQEKLPSGALRAPVFHALHEDYPARK